MKIVLNELKNYLELTLGVHVRRIEAWQNQDKLPFFLSDFYDFYEISLLKHTCILLIVKGEAEITPGMVEKHKQEIVKRWPGLYVYVHQSISPHNRSRLMQKHISFIIPGNQMYLPEFGIDLREHFKKHYKKDRKFLSPAAQAVIIYALLATHKKWTPTILAKQLGYSIMSVNRAFNELKAANIGDVQKIGRELYWTFGSKKELWNQTKEMMRSPVKKRIWVKKLGSLKETKILAGLSALSYYTMLNPPTLPEYALSSDAFKDLKLSKDEILPSYEEAFAKLEIWQYDPNLFQLENCIDPFSLYLSLKEHSDERVESALEEMIEKIKW